MAAWLFLACTALVTEADPRFLLLPATLEDDRAPFQGLTFADVLDKKGRPLAQVTAVRGHNMFEEVQTASVAWSADTWALWSVKLRVWFAAADGAKESGLDSGGLRRELLQLALHDAVAKSKLLKEGPGLKLGPVLPTPLLDPATGAVTTVPGPDGAEHVILGKLLAAVLTGYKKIQEQETGPSVVRRSPLVSQEKEISKPYISPLRLSSVVYEAALAPEARPAAPPAAAGDIAACEKLVPILGNDWFYGLDVKTNTRKYKLAAEYGLMEWGMLKSSKAGEEVSKDEADEWAQLACQHIWSTYCAPALEGIHHGLADALGAPLGAAHADEVRALGLAGIQAIFEGIAKVDHAAIVKATQVVPGGLDMMEGGEEDDFSAMWSPTWEAALAQLKESELEDFLEFVTGNRALPSAGGVTIQVQVIEGNFPDTFAGVRLTGPEKTFLRASLAYRCGTMVAHTCFNQVQIPIGCWGSADTLANQLKMTLRMNREFGGGFGEA